MDHSEIGKSKPSDVLKAHKNVAATMALVLLRYEIIAPTAKAGWIDYARDDGRLKGMQGPERLENQPGSRVVPTCIQF